MPSSFDIVVLIRAMRKERPGEDIFIERSNGNRFRLRPEDDIMDVCGFVSIVRKDKDVAINPEHIITIFSKGDL